MSERCETCRYWDEEAFNGDWGSCRRYPPYGEIAKGWLGRSTPHHRMTLSPSRAHHWCGEYEPKDNEVTKDE